MKGKKKSLLGVILLLGIGFASVSTVLYLNGDVNIAANSEDFDVKFTKALIDNEDKTSEAISEDGKTITYVTKELKALNDKSKLDFEVTNNSSIYDAEVSIECTSGESGEYYQITKDVATSIPSKTTETGSIEVQKIEVTTEDIEEAFTCTLTAVASERTTQGEEKEKVFPNHIIDTGERCFENKEAGSCTPGTEIRYMVNDSDEKTFYVLHDDGETLTLQDSSDTVSNTIWYLGDNDNTKGPTAALQALETATSSWNNVNTLNYTMGTTIFNNNAFTGCSSSGCTTNMYTLNKSNVKVRMITFQEAVELGCKTLSENSCPTWLRPSSSAYWTMSATSEYPVAAWFIYSSGWLDSHFVSYNISARAVVEISK